MTARFAIATRDRRALVIGALLLIPALCWRFVVQPYVRSRAELSARVEEQRGLLAREIAVAGAVERMSAELSRARPHFAARQAWLLPQRDPVAATGALAALVSDEARRRSVLLDAMESRQAEPADGELVGVRIEVRGRTDLEGLLEWLGALESGGRLLRLDALTVASVHVADAEASSPKILRVAAVIRGYVRSAETVQ